MLSRVLISSLAVAAGFAALMSPALQSTAKADVLFTTYDDFANWTSSSASTVVVSASTAYDADGATTNGLGNNSAAGATGTAGSLQVTATSLGWGNITSSPSPAGNLAFLTAIDPGATASTAVAYSGELQLVYTIPTVSSGNFLQMGVNLAYEADGYWNSNFASSSTALGTVDGLTTYSCTIPYTITAGAWNGFGFSVMTNSNYVPTGPFYVDSIQTVAVPTPEPASLGCAAGAGLLLLRRRRRV